PSGVLGRRNSWPSGCEATSRKALETSIPMKRGVGCMSGLLGRVRAGDIPTWPSLANAESVPLDCSGSSPGESAATTKLSHGLLWPRHKRTIAASHPPWNHTRHLEDSEPVPFPSASPFSYTLSVD